MTTTIRIWCARVFIVLHFVRTICTVFYAEFCGVVVIGSAATCAAWPGLAWRCRCCYLHLLVDNSRIKNKILEFYLPLLVDGSSPATAAGGGVSVADVAAAVATTAAWFFGRCGGRSGF